MGPRVEIRQLKLPLWPYLDMEVVKVLLKKVNHKCDDNKYLSESENDDYSFEHLNLIG